MSSMKVLLAGIVMLLAAGAQAQPVACAEPFKAMLRAEIYFGRNIGGQVGVSESQWAAFVRRELAPRFPDGLTAIDSKGQWRDPSGAIMREPSKVVIIVMADDVASRERLAAATAAYKQRFNQKSIGVVTQPVCASF
jgi:hypothetical protein